MKYKNITKGVLEFRAHDKEGIKRKVVLKAGKSFESDRKATLSGLEEIKQKSKGDDK